MTPRECYCCSTSAVCVHSLLLANKSPYQLKKWWQFGVNSLFLPPSSGLKVRFHVFGRVLDETLNTLQWNNKVDNSKLTADTMWCLQTFKTHKCHLFSMLKHDINAKWDLRYFLTSIWGQQPNTHVGTMENMISLRGMSGTLALRRDVWGASCSIWEHPDTKHNLVITLCPLGAFYKTWLTGFFHLCAGFGLPFDILCKCFQQTSTTYNGKSTSLPFPLSTCFWLGGLQHNMETKWKFSNGN